jgi:hypothetical protein
MVSLCGKLWESTGRIVKEGWDSLNDGRPGVIGRMVLGERIAVV